MSATASRPSFQGRRLFALLWGLFLGLAVLKFVAPVALEDKLRPPTTLHEWVGEWWVGWWGRAIAAVILAAGAWAGVLPGRPRAFPLRPNWRWALPGAWFAWQLVAAARTEDALLTTRTLGHFAVVLGAWLAGWWVIGRGLWRPWLLIGLMLGFTVCAVRAVSQKLFEFPADRQALVEGQLQGWTNYTAADLDRLRADEVLIRTNGVDVVNPVMLIKLEKGRAHGTLFYPNALAGLVLLLGPLALAAAWLARGALRPPISGLAFLLAAGLVLGALLASGSKAGWLIGVAQLAAATGALRISSRLRWAIVALLVAGGAAVFALRFSRYLEGGAGSAGARLGYWKAAVAEAAAQPMTGAGPGAFFRAYERLRSPESEPARLAHNDYLEQFSDSGLPGGLAYAAWIGCLGAAGMRLWRKERDPWSRALLLGAAGWFAQGFVEFGLYIPALGWTAFTLAGVIASETPPSATPPPPSPARV